MNEQENIFHVDMRFFGKPSWSWEGVDEERPALCFYPAPDVKVVWMVVGHNGEFSLHRYEAFWNDKHDDWMVSHSSIQSWKSSIDDYLRFIVAAVSRHQYHL